MKCLSAITISEYQGLDKGMWSKMNSPSNIGINKLYPLNYNLLYIGIHIKYLSLLDNRLIDY